MAPYNMTAAATQVEVAIVATGQTYSISAITTTSGETVSAFRQSVSNVIKMTASDTFTITLYVGGESSDVVDVDGTKKWSGLQIEFLGNA